MRIAAAGVLCLIMTQNTAAQNRAADESAVRDLVARYMDAREKLADMSKHNYVTGRGGVEPNAHITPDKKWVVFTGQFAPGQRHVYAVDIEARR